MEVNKVVDVMHLAVDVTMKLLLVLGIIFVAAYAINVSHKSMLAVQEMTNKIDMMFIKS